MIERLIKYLSKKCNINIVDIKNNLGVYFIQISDSYNIYNFNDYIIIKGDGNKCKSVETELRRLEDFIIFSELKYESIPSYSPREPNLHSLYCKIIIDEQNENIINNLLTINKFNL